MVALEVSDLACRRGGRAVFARLGFALPAGETLRIVGPNGSGKSSLLRALALLSPSTGAIRCDGVDVRADRDRWRAQFAWLGHADALKSDLTLVENLVAAETVRAGVAPAPARLRAALERFDLGALANRPARLLSAGQRRRTALARVALSAAPLWLLDEPGVGLDASAQAALSTALAGHRAAGGCAVVATHGESALPGARALDLADFAPRREAEEAWA